MIRDACLTHKSINPRILYKLMLQIQYRLHLRNKASGHNKQSVIFGKPVTLIMFHVKQLKKILKTSKKKNTP